MYGITIQCTTVILKFHSDCTDSDQELVPYYTSTLYFTSAFTLTETEDELLVSISVQCS